MAEGVDGLLRDKSRPPGIAPLDTELVDRVVALTLEAPQQEATHYAGFPIMPRRCLRASGASEYQRGLSA